MKLTGMDWIRSELRRKGYVTNYDAYRHYVIRLAARIEELKRQGFKFDPKLCGFLPGTKNWCYVLQGRRGPRLLPKPRRTG